MPVKGGAIVFEKLDSQSVKIVLVAQEEARRQGHRNVDVEQLLLGLMADGQGVPAQVLGEFGLQNQKVRQRIQEGLGQGTEFIGVETPFTERLKRLLELAWGHAQEDGRNSISPNDLLCAMAKTTDGLAGQILTEAKICTIGVKEKLAAL